MGVGLTLGDSGAGGALSRRGALFVRTRGACGARLETCVCARAAGDRWAARAVLWESTRLFGQFVVGLHLIRGSRSDRAKVGGLDVFPSMRLCCLARAAARSVRRFARTKFVGSVALLRSAAEASRVAMRAGRVTRRFARGSGASRAGAALRAREWDARREGTLGGSAVVRGYAGDATRECGLRDATRE